MLNRRWLQLQWIRCCNRRHCAERAALALLHVGVLLLAMCSGGTTSPPATHDVSPVLLDEDLQTTPCDMRAMVSASSPGPSPALPAEDLQSALTRMAGKLARAVLRSSGLDGMMLAQAPPAATEDPASGFVDWPCPRLGLELGAPDVVRLAVAPDGLRVAIAVEGASVSVHEVDSGGCLSPPCWSNDRRDWWPCDLAWAGDDLIVWRVTGAAEDMLAAVLPADDQSSQFVRRVYEYMVPRSDLIRCDPESGQETKLLSGGGTLLLDPARSLLMLCDPTWTWLTEGLGEKRFSAAIFDWPGLVSKGNLLVDKRYTSLVSVGGRRDQYPMLFPDEIDPQILLPGQVEGESYERESFLQWVDVVSALSVRTGAYRPLTDAAAMRLWPDLAGLPTIVTLDGGQPAIACACTRWRNAPYRIVYLDGEGKLLREHVFGQSRKPIDRAVGMHAAWSPKALTPDGRYLIVQGSGSDMFLAPGEPDWVGIVDLQSMTGRLLARIPNIEHVYGWVRDEFLVVQLSVPPGTDGVRLGVVHAARSVDGQP